MTDLERLELILRRVRGSFYNKETETVQLIDLLITHLTEANNAAYEQTRRKVFPNDYE